HRGGALEASPDSDDVLRIHPRRFAARAGLWREFGRAPVAGYRGLQRHVDGDATGDLHRPRTLRDDRKLRGTPTARRRVRSDCGGCAVKRVVPTIGLT